MGDNSVVENEGIMITSDYNFIMDLRREAFTVFISLKNRK